MHGPECGANVYCRCRSSPNWQGCAATKDSAEFLRPESKTNRSGSRQRPACEFRAPKSWGGGHRDLGGLAFVYETAGGLRVILAHREMDPCSEETGRTLDFVGSDPLYLRLCRNQKSFRARITPKPWRCGHHAPTERWPFLETKSAKSFEAWESEYLRKIQDYSFVRLVERVGDGKIHAESRRCWRCTMKSRVPIAAICVWRRTDAFNCFPFHRISSLCIADA
jgi:hypothetical protein